MVSKEPIIVDTKKVGEPRFYRKTAPTLQSNDWKEPLKVMIEDSKRRTRKGGFCDDRICTDIAPTLMSASNTGGKHQSGISHKNPLVVVKSALIQSRGLETREDGVSHCLKGAGGGTAKNFVAYGPATTTGGQTRSTSGGSSQSKGNIIQATLGDSPLRASPITTFSVLDSLARHSRLPERGKGLETLVGRFSTRSPALRGLKDPRYYSWKTSKDSSATIKGRPSELSWKSWGILAIGSNGRCSTLSGSASPRTGSVSSLSDILETDVPDRYFLSKRLVDSLLEHKRRHEEAGHGFGMNIIAYQGASESGEAESRKT